MQHEPKDGRRDGDKRCRELGEQAHDDEEKAAAIPSRAVSAASKSDDAVVLGEGRDRRDGHESGKNTVEAVRQHTTLNTRFISSALHLDAGHIARSSDVANGLGSTRNRQSRWYFAFTMIG